jgi:hypothetical protein
MNHSVIFYLDRGNCLHVLACEDLPHFDTCHPAMDLAVDLMNAGFEGVTIDERRLSNGRYFHALNSDPTSPEGQAIQALCELHAAGRPLPSSQLVVQAVLDEYARRAKESSND